MEVVQRPTLALEHAVQQKSAGRVSQRPEGQIVGHPGIVGGAPRNRV